MLIEFSVKNFLSFRDKVTLSMEKGNGNENIENTFKVGNTELLKTCAIYGANASGKSNLIEALTCAILIVRQSAYIPIDASWNIVKPFLFDKKNHKNPSEFEFIFIVNNIKYKYKFSLTSKKIINEELVAYYTQKPTTIFSRTNTNDYKFIIEDENDLNLIKIRNTENKLFLSTASTWNYNKTKDAYMWFINSIDTYNSFDGFKIADLIQLSNGDKSLKDFTLRLLKESDIVINDFSVNYEVTDIDPTQVFGNIENINKNISSIDNIKIELIHQVIDENNHRGKYKLSMEEESSGTRILFGIAPYLKKAFESPTIIIVDELEKSLHSVLVEYLIKIFNNKNINKVNSQLIFTTHAINLLNLDLLRRDQIWFTEKDPKTGSSCLYPLDSFSVRKDENIQKGYINGRYGAIPFINDINLWQENK